MRTSPTVTIAIPAYNEASDIGTVISGFLATRYDNLVEIFVADGGSIDNTREIVRNLSETDSRVKLIDNPQKTQSYGLNIAMKVASGDIFLIADAHSEYAPDYVERCVESLIESHALSVGGAARSAAKAPFQAAVALATRSVLGNGGAKYRNPDYEGFADTVFPGCLWREIILHLGGFNVDAVTNQDAEFNLRLRKLVTQDFQLSDGCIRFVPQLNTESNRAIYISPKIKVWYFPRQTWKALFKQYLKYGRGRYLTSTKHSEDFQLRGKLPFLALSSFALIALISVFVSLLRGFVAAVIVLGLLFICVESGRINWKFRERFKTDVWKGDSQKVPSMMFRCLFCVVVFATMPTAHFLGYGFQLIRHKILKVKGW